MSAAILKNQCLLLVLVLTCTVSSQNPASAPLIPDRMVFRVVASNRIDTGRAKSGDKVKMLVAAPEILDDGTAIKDGTQLEGVVVESVAYSSSNREARLSIRIDRLRLGKNWIPIQAFIIAQGQIRTTRIVPVTSPCFDPFSKRSAAQDINCNENPQTAPVPGLKTSSTSPVLHDVELVETETPVNSTRLVSHKGNIVIEQNMAFLIRNMIPR